MAAHSVFAFAKDFEAMDGTMVLEDRTLDEEEEVDKRGGEKR